jgi:hypothetical protein
MRERVSAQDAVADAKRMLDWRGLLVRTSYVVAMLVSLTQLQAAGLTDAMRIGWMVLPIPFLVAGFIEWGRHERKADELQRATVRDANGVAFRSTLLVLCAMALIERAYGLPLVVQVAAGLPALTIAWDSALLLALLAWAVSFSFAHRRRVGG